MYAFVEKSADNAALILRIENIDKAVETLEKNNVTILNNEGVAKI